MNHPTHNPTVWLSHYWSGAPSFGIYLEFTGEPYFTHKEKIEYKNKEKGDTVTKSERIKYEQKLDNSIALQDMIWGGQPIPKETLPTRGCFES